MSADNKEIKKELYYDIVDTKAGTVYWIYRFYHHTKISKSVQRKLIRNYRDKLDGVISYFGEKYDKYVNEFKKLHGMTENPSPDDPAWMDFGNRTIALLAANSGFFDDLPIYLRYIGNSDNGVYLVGVSGVFNCQVDRVFTMDPDVCLYAMTEGALPL